MWLSSSSFSFFRKAAYLSSSCFTVSSSSLCLISTFRASRIALVMAVTELSVLRAAVLQIFAASFADFAASRRSLAASLAVLTLVVACASCSIRLFFCSANSSCLLISSTRLLPLFIVYNICPLSFCFSVLLIS